MAKVYRQGVELANEIEKTVAPLEGVALWNLGQAGVVLKGRTDDGNQLETTMVIDPYLTHSIETNHPGTEFVREFEPPLSPESLRGVSAVLLTHHHDDHMDLETICRFHQVSPNTKFIVPASHVSLLGEAGVVDESIISARAGEIVRVGSVKILPVAAAHTSYEKDKNGNDLYLGYTVYLNRTRIYHSGDTVVTEELIDTMRDVKPHIALLPVNGGDYYRTRRGIVGNMSAREAVDFALEIGADLLIPNHYDMFPNNRDNPAHLVDYLFVHHPEMKYHMLAVGERFIYMP